MSLWRYLLLTLALFAWGGPPTVTALTLEERLQEVLLLRQRQLWTAAFDSTTEGIRVHSSLQPFPPELGRLWFVRGTLARTLQDSATALDAWMQVWEHYPPLGDYAAREMLQLYAAQDQLNAMIALMDQLALRHPFSRLLPESFLLLARTQQRLGYRDMAYHTLHRIFQLPPSQPVPVSALTLLAQLYEERGDLLRAAQTWQRLGETYLQDSQAAEAFDRSRKLIAQIPAAQRPVPEPQQLLASLDALATAKQWAEVDLRLDILQKLSVPEALRTAILLKHSEFAVRRKQWAVAEGTLQSLLGRSLTGTERAQVHALLAELYQRQEQPQQSLHHHAQVLQYGPRSAWAADALLALAHDAEEQGNFEQAHTYYRSLSSAFPDYTPAQEARWNKGWALYQAQQYEAAFGWWLEASQAYPEADFMPQLLYWQGRVLQRLGRPGEVIPLYQRIVRDYPTHYYSVLAYNALRATQVPASLPPFGETASVIATETPALYRLSLTTASGQPTQERFHLIRAQEMRVLQMTEEAIEEIRVLVKILPETPATQYFLAGLFADHQRYLDIFRMLNRLVGRLKAAEIRGLPRGFWTLLYPRPFWDDVVQQANRVGLDPYLVLSIMRQESAFNPAAVSRAGARGLMQLMPATAREVASKLALANPSREVLHEPSYNITLGVDYFASTLRRFEGNVELALAGYNGGPGRVARWRSQWPELAIDEFVENIPIQETRLYVKLILRNWMMYERLYRTPGAQG